MSVERNASSCRWATATLLLPRPHWFESEDAPWACVRDPAPRILPNTSVCARCERWEQKSPADVDGDTRVSAPMFVDWFAGPPPHEFMR